MISIPKELLNSQAGLEEALRLYFESLMRDCGDTLNGLLRPRLLGCEYEQKTLTIAVGVERWMTNPNLVLHGGITASVADMCMGLASRCFSGGLLTPTIHLDVTYLTPAALGTELVCRAQCVRAGFTMCSATARLWCAGDEDTPVATATATYYVNHHTPG